MTAAECAKTNRAHESCDVKEKAGRKACGFERKARPGASVTVFLTLVFMVMLTLVLTCLESAYLAAQRGFAFSVSEAAVESLFADYFAPLFEEYHVFGINKKADALKTSMDEYLLGMMDENVFGLYPKSASADELVTFADAGGEGFLKQAVEYEKIGAIGDFVTDFMTKMGILAGQDEECRLIKRKMNAEKKLAILDKEVITLMKRIDGIETDSGGLSLKRDGSLAVQPYFVKKLFVGSPDRVNARVNNAELYGALCSSYYNVYSALDELKSLGSSCYDLSAKEYELGLELEALRSEREAVASEQAGSDSKSTANRTGSKNADAADSTMKNSESEGTSAIVAELDSRIDSLEDSLSEAGRSLREAKKSYDKVFDNLKIQTNCVKDKAIAANTQIDEIKKMQPELKDAVLDFESEFLEYMRGKTVEGAGASATGSGTVLSELGDSLELMKGYAGLTSDSMAGLNLDRMRETLKDDISVLERAAAAIKEVSSPPQYDGTERASYSEGSSARESFGQAIDACKSIYSAYSFDGLEFDYSTLSLNTIEDKVTGALEGIVADGICRLIFPPTRSLSDCDATDLLNPVAVLCGNNQKTPSVGGRAPGGADGERVPDGADREWAVAGADEGSAPGGADGERVSDDADGVLDSVLDTDDPSDLLQQVNSDVAGSLAGDVTDKLLYVKYMLDHFRRLEADKALSGIGSKVSGPQGREGSEAKKGSDVYGLLSDRKGHIEGHVLDYEQEYLICGGKTDRINLERVATRLMLMRLPGSLIYCLTDLDVREKADAFATAVVGFTGLPFVVSIVKYLTIIVWASVQAIVEVSAIMNGKKIAFVTDKSIFVVGLEDIPRLNGTLVSRRVAMMAESEGVPDYEDYLLFLMLLAGEEKEIARTMSLVQANLRDKYSADFSLGDCIISARVTMCLGMKRKYIGGHLLGPDSCTVAGGYAY